MLARFLERAAMVMDSERIIEAVSFLLAAAAAAWAALACRRAGQLGRAGADAKVWAAIATLFFVLACARVVQIGPWLGMVLRRLAREAGAYQSRRPYQIVATIALAVLAVVAMAFGLRSIWIVLRRYRLAAGCVTVVLASGLIRFISLHEVDTWNQEWPWIRVSLDLATSALTAAVAITRARQASQ